MIQLDGFEKRFKVASSESLQPTKSNRDKELKIEEFYLVSYVVVVALDDFQEECGPVLHRFTKDLQQVAVVIVIDQDLQFLCPHLKLVIENNLRKNINFLHLQDGQVFLDLDRRLGQFLAQLFVIDVRDG